MQNISEMVRLAVFKDGIFAYETEAEYDLSTGMIYWNMPELSFADLAGKPRWSAEIIGEPPKVCLPDF